MSRHDEIQRDELLDGITQHCVHISKAGHLLDQERYLEARAEIRKSLITLLLLLARQCRENGDHDLADEFQQKLRGQRQDGD